MSQHVALGPKTMIEPPVARSSKQIVRSKSVGPDHLAAGAADLHGRRVLGARRARSSSRSVMPKGTS